MRKKLLSIILAAIMVVSLLPVTAFAAWFPETAFNSALVEEMKTIYGDDAETVLQYLYEKGVIDRHGNLLTSETFSVEENGDKAILSIDALKTRAAGMPDDAEVTVNGVDTTWGVVKNFLNFAAALATVQECMESEEELTQAHIDNIRSFYDALLSGKVGFANEAPVNQNETGKIYFWIDEVNPYNGWVDFCSIDNSGKLQRNTNGTMSQAQKNFMKYVELYPEDDSTTYQYSKQGVQTSDTQEKLESYYPRYYLISRLFSKLWTQDELCKAAGDNKYHCVTVSVPELDTDLTRSSLLYPADPYPAERLNEDKFLFKALFNDKTETIERDSNGNPVRYRFDIGYIAPVKGNDVLDQNKNVDPNGLSKILAGGYQSKSKAAQSSHPSPTYFVMVRMQLIEYLMNVSSSPDNNNVGHMMNAYVKIGGTGEALPINVHFSEKPAYYMEDGEVKSFAEYPDYIYIDLPAYLGNGIELTDIRYYSATKYDPDKPYDYFLDADNKLDSGKKELLDFVVYDHSSLDVDQEINTYFYFITRTKSESLKKNDLQIVYNDTWKKFAATSEESFSADIQRLNLMDYEALLGGGTLAEPLKLTYEFDATKDLTSLNVAPKYFTWASSDENVAVVSQTTQKSYTDEHGHTYTRVVAEISPVAAGTVNFILTVSGGESVLTYSSAKMRISVPDLPYLMFPSALKDVSALSGNDILLLFSTNLHKLNLENNATETTPIGVKVFRAGEKDGTPVYSDILQLPGTEEKLRITIPATVNLCAGKYTVVLSAEYDDEGTVKTLETSCGLEVKEGPITIVSEADWRNYVDKNEDYTFAWTWKGVNEGSSAKKWFYEVISQTTGTVVKTESFTDFSISSVILKASDLPIPDGSLKERFTVSVYASNDPATVPWSSESVLLMAYDSSKLGILVKDVEINGQKVCMQSVDGSTFEMDFHDFINGMVSDDGVSLGFTSENFQLQQLSMALRHENIVHIKNANCVWSLVDDCFTWTSDGDDGVEFRGREDGYKYIPTKDFQVFSVENGKITLNAVHVNTGLSAKPVSIEYSRLENQLYLLQFYPLTKTTVEFMHNGQKKVFKSDDKGQLALYLPEGFNKDVKLYFTAEYEGAHMVGMAYADQLKSGEGSLYNNEAPFYPINNFKLVEYKSDIYLKMPDGKPLSNTDVTVRGGAYLNGEYVAKADLLKISTDVLDQDPNHSTGLDAQTFRTDKNGKLTIYYNAGQFDDAGSLSGMSEDKDISFVYEIQFADDAYKPEIVKATLMSGNSNRNTSKTVYMRTASKKGSYYDYQTLEAFKDNRTSIGINVLDEDYTYIGSGENYKTTELTQFINLWGFESYVEKDTDTRQSTLQDTQLKAVIQNSSQIALKNQNVAVRVYEFSTFPYIEATLLLNEETYDGWLKTNESDSISTSLLDNGNEILRLFSPYKIINQIGAERPETSSDLQKITNDATEEIKKSLSFEELLSDLIPGGDILAKGISFFSAINGEREKDGFNLLLIPTVDPTVFNVFLTLNDYKPNPDEFPGSVDDSLTSNIAERVCDLMSQFKDEEDSGDTGSSGGASINVDMDFRGAMIARAGYDINNSKWVLEFVGGDFGAGVTLSLDYSMSVPVGPATATLSFGAHAGLDALLSGRMSCGMLTDILLDAGMEAFCGFGIDVLVASVEIGIYGGVNFEAEQKVLVSHEGTKEGTQFRGHGSVGVKLVAEVLMVSYEKDLASASFEFDKTRGEYDAIEEEWAGLTRGGNTYSATLRNGNLLLTVDRTVPKKSFMRLGNPAPSGTNLITDPDLTGDESTVLSEDGKMAVYLKDGKISWAEKTATDFYTEKGFIDSKANEENPEKYYGDFYINVSGSNGRYIAVWSRQTDELQDNDPVNVSAEELYVALSSTEIFASVYENGVWSTPVQLTQNSAVDISPKVSVNGNTAILAWRSAIGSDPDSPLVFDVQDEIQMSILTDSRWTERKTIYNGSAGALKSMALSAGSTYSVIGYTVDTHPDAEAAGGYETYYSVIRNDDMTSKFVRATTNNYVDERVNAALATVNGKDCAVLAWYAKDGDNDDINLLCIDLTTGLICGDFPVSVSAMRDLGITSEFKLVTGAQNTLDALAIIWSAHNGDDSYTVSGAKFWKGENGEIGITPAQEICKTSESVALDKFDGYTDTDCKTVRILLTESDYSGNDLEEIDSISIKDIVDNVIHREDFATEQEYKDARDKLLAEESLVILTKVAKNKMECKSYTFIDKLDIKSKVLTEEVIPGLPVAIQFTIRNGGISVLHNIKLNNNPTGVTVLAPGDETQLIYYHMLGTDPEKMDYCYDFTADELTAGDNESGKILLNKPTVRMDKIRTIEAGKGERTIAVELSNNSFINFAGNHMSVKIGLYSTDGVTQVVAPITLDSDELEALDNGGYSAVFHISKLQLKNLLNGKEVIPKEGIPIRVIASVYDEYANAGDPVDKKETFFTLRALGDGTFRVSYEAEREDSTYTVNLKLENTSLAAKTAESILVTIYDTEGNVIDRKITYNGDVSDYIQVDSESTAEKNIVFTVDPDITIARTTVQVIPEGKIPVETPSVEGKAYTGETLTADVDSIGKPYTVTKNNGGTEVGSYDVVLTLSDTIIYKWSDSDEATKTLRFDITKADNSWTTEPKIDSVTYGTTISPIGAAKFGDVTVTYVGTGDTNYASSTTVPTNVGTYKATFSVATTNNYSALTKDVYFTISNPAAPTYPSTGGSGNSSSTITVPVSGNENSVNVSATVSGGTATVDPIADADLAKVTEGESVELDLSGAGKNVDTAKIPTETVEKIAEKSSMTVKLPAATVEFDKAATAEIADQAKGSNIELVVDDVKEVSLNAVQKEAVGKLDTAIIIDAYLESNGSKLCTSDNGGFGGGSAKVILPYEIKNNRKPENYSVFYVSEAGKLEKLNAAYDVELKAFVFEIEHFSVYAVAFEQFVDIDTNAYYYDAVKWAASNGITDGTDSTHFSPNGITNRGQMVTFLWRAAGKPEPTLTECPFTDVKSGKYYYKAVLWAYENGITDGTSATTFEPDKNVSRAQTVTFLWRYAGKPVLDYWMQMTDVASGQYYTEAVRWALAEGITEGTSKTTFSPNKDCLRGQIVTFLYRSLVK